MASEAALRTVGRYEAHVPGDIATVAADLDQFLAMLERWQRVQNLVSRETLPAFWERHVADSLQLLRLIEPRDRLMLDLGSGGGFPALPLAIALRSSAVSFVLVEPNQRKVSFLRAVVRELDLSVDVRAERAEQIDSRETLRPDVITSRAMASLPALIRLAAPFFGPGTRALFHKGREFVEELAETRALWEFDVLILPSDTSADGAVLEMRNVHSKTTS